MPPKKGVTLERWRKLLPPLAASSADLPGTETLRAKLERLLDRSQEIIHRQAALEAERQELTREVCASRTGRGYKVKVLTTKE